MRGICSLFLLALCSVNSWAQQAPENSLKADIEFLASEALQGRKTGTEGAQLAASFIQKRFQSLNLDPLTSSGFYTHDFDYDVGFSTRKGQNVVATIGSTDRPAIVLTAHYDHLGKVRGKIHYGADDNASGVAVLLYIAAQARSRDWHHQLIFLATDAEEGGLHGAKAFVREHPSTIARTAVNINLDMLSYLNRPQRLYLTGVKTHTAFKGVVEQLNQQVLSDSAIRLMKEHRQPRGRKTGSGRINYKQASDHAAFAKVDIPYLFLGVGDHSYYHTPRDTADRINEEDFRVVADVAMALLETIDQRLVQAR